MSQRKSIDKNYFSQDDTATEASITAFRKPYFWRTMRLCYTQALSVELVYRFALLQSFVSSVISFIGLVFFWMAAGAAQGNKGTYTSGLVVTYFLLTSAHALFQENPLTWILSTSIRTGKLSAFMLRPFPFIISLIAQAAATATIRLVILVPIVCGLFASVPLIREVFLNLDQGLFPFYIAALVLALMASWATRIVVGLLAFDMAQVWGPELIFLALYSAASGIAYPLDLLPQTFWEIAAWTPVYYMVGFPALLLLGRLSEAAIWQGFAQGSLVVALTLVVVVLMWQRGLKKFEALGI